MGRKAIQKQLSTGELHPLLISFDAPQCVFPLRISAVGGQASEVSVYVLSAQPLLDHFIFDQATKKLNQRWAEWDKTRPQREKSSRESTRMTGRFSLQYQMENLAIPGRRLDASGRDWSKEDLVEIADEAYPGYPPSLWQDYFYGVAQELLECLHAKAPQIKACAKEFTRLGTRDWYLTRQVWVFKPEEMQDLEFQPALPCLAKALQQPYGSAAAAVLAQFGKDGAPSLITACASANSIERVNVSTVLREIRDERLSDLLLGLFKDSEPKVRLRSRGRRKRLGSKIHRTSVGVLP